MTLTIGDTAPDFEAETTEGKISFHDWIGDSWAVLFSHPKDFTPVCTTELGYMASIKPEFERRNVKVIGLSVDSTSDHEGWARDIEETQGTAPNYPIIGDADFEISKSYGMLGADVSGDPKDRTAADNQTVRNVFVIGPDKKVKLVLVYPMTTGRNFDEVLRVIDSLQLTAHHRVSTPVNWKDGDDVIIAGSVSNDEAKQIWPDGWEEPKPYIRIVPQPRYCPQVGFRRSGIPPRDPRLRRGTSLKASRFRAATAPTARPRCSSGDLIANQSAGRPVSPGVSTHESTGRTNVHGASTPAGDRDRGGRRRNRALSRSCGRRRSGRRTWPGDRDRPDRDHERTVRGSGTHR